MTKQAEIDYFKNMTPDAERFARDKPFSADERGAYLLDMGQILSLIRKPPARLLDVGCGSGWTTGMFARSGYEALGVDIAPSAVRLAAASYGQTGAVFEVQDFEQLPFENRFDVAVLYDCLHHAESPGAVISGVYKALQARGEVIVVEPGRGHERSATAQSAIAAHGVTEKDMPPSATTGLLRQAGFTEIRVFPRVQFQLVESKGTGGIVRLLSPVLGRRLAGALKTMKNTLFAGSNGVVLAVKAK